MINQLDTFEQSLLLLAKRQYRYEGDIVHGAMVIAGHIAGIPHSSVNLRQVAKWLVNILVSLDRTSPHALTGGLASVLSEFLEGIARNFLMPPETERPGLNYWRSVVLNLFGQITITRIKMGDSVYIDLPEPDPTIQAALDLAPTSVTIFRCWQKHSQLTAVVGGL